MPGYIRRRDHSQVAVGLLVLLLVAMAWWLEDRWLLPSGWQTPPGQLATGEHEVQRVIDGDTIVLRQNRLRVRLQGIDTPETVQPNTPVEPWGPEASDYTKQFIADADGLVRIEINGETVDRYGRHLAFVWHEGRLLNEELVRQGLARAKTTFDFGQAMKDRLRQAQDDAQTAKRGIWGKSLSRLVSGP